MSPFCWLRSDSEGRERTELTFDPCVVTEIALSRALIFLYTGVVELDEKAEGLDETIKISQLLNLPELGTLCENARKSEEFLNPSIGTWLNDRNSSIAKKLFLNKVCTNLPSCHLLVTSITGA